MRKEKMVEQIIASVGPMDAAALERCQRRLDNLTKPLGSLHHLEFLALKLAGVTGQYRPALQQKQAVLVVAADHGLVKALCKEGKTTAQRVADACRVGRRHIRVARGRPDPAWLADHGRGDFAGPVRNRRRPPRPLWPRW